MRLGRGLQLEGEVNQTLLGGQGPRGGVRKKRGLREVNVCRHAD